MHPYLLDLGWFQLRFYGLMIGIGILAATRLAHARAARRGLPWADAIWDLSLWAVAGGVVGARLWEVVFTWEWYRDRPWEVLMVWRGGVSIQGAVLGGIVALAWWARRHRVDTWRLLDLAIGPVALAQGIGRIGCLMNGDAFGIPIAATGLPRWLGVTYAPGTPAWHAFGAQPLVPAEAFEGLADFAIAGLLMFWRPGREVPGWRPLAYGVLYSVTRFLLEFWRADSLRTGGGLKAAQLMAAATVAVCVALWAWRRRTIPLAVEG